MSSPHDSINPIDWRSQMRQAIRDYKTLIRHFPEAARLKGLEEAVRRFPMAITPYYASLIKRADYSDPVFAQSVPHPDEMNDPPWLSDDPLAEITSAPHPHLIHRYTDRLLLLATPDCATYCRHCFRKRIASQPRSIPPLGTDEINQTVQYLQQHPEVRDVLVSGGDPLTLPSSRLEQILKALRSVPTVEIIRIATRVPVTLPMRITPALARLIRHFNPVYLNTHFNHPVELTTQAQKALSILADAGIPLANQTVLLRGINDSARVLSELFRALLRNRVRPYYLFQCDLVRGIEHFRTPLQTGLDIMQELRASLDGMAIPHFALDTPGSGGKIELLPNAIISRTPDHTLLRNPSGEEVLYPEPRS